MKLAIPTTHLDAYLALEYLASEPYTRFVFETPEQAQAIARFYVESRVGEIAEPLGSIAFDDDDQPLGMIAFASGDDLKQARMAAAMALVRGRRIDPRGPVRDRMLLAGDTLIDVQSDDLYLSRISVMETARERGLASRLLARYEEAARARGLRRLALEVSPIHAAAVRLYERHGFAQAGMQRVTDPESGRELTYLHLFKTL
ncbi:MAG: GNAT family N-acetyltransferase [Myxococcales bacterium]|nr:GNAT family N-acetyltransferase [Myxococcales bacterium]